MAAITVEAPPATERPTVGSTALQDSLVAIDVVRAWKEPEYRERLTPAEKAMLAPHPSGEIDLTGTHLDPVLMSGPLVRMLGYITFTVDGEVCCSTGHFPCGTWDFSCRCQVA